MESMSNLNEAVWELSGGFVDSTGVARPVLLVRTLG